MNFTDLSFLLGFPAVVLLHWLLPHRFRWALLLAVSYLFYMNGLGWTGLLLLFTTLASYLAGLRLPKARTTAARRGWLALGAGAPLGCLFLFKYTDFLLGSGAALLSFGFPELSYQPLNLLLPIGISFYTFQTLSYVLDVHRGTLEPERHFGYYALFISFFPQLVAGPIERPQNLLPQLRAERTFCAEDLRAGAARMLRGFLKKLLIADPLAALCDPVFAAPGEAGGPAVVFASVCFALQIYCDFSGYSDIACGAARCMGIRLMENFRQPYGAETVREFWRRWHISLTQWFTDYLYIPLGGSRVSLPRHLANLTVVFLVSGLWHGASWHFVAWGGIHALYLVLGVLWRRRFPERGEASRPLRLFRTARTFALCCLAWIFFRAESVSDALTLLSRLPAGWDSLAQSLSLTGLTPLAGLRIALALLVLWLLERLPARNWAELSPAGAARQTLACWLAGLALAVGWLALLAANGESAFLYFQF